MRATGARILGQIFRSGPFARITYAVTALNPFLLARATETLSDLLSAVLVFLSVLLSLPRDPRQDTGTSNRRTTATAAASLAAASMAVMVRPANLAVFLAILVIWLARQLLWREIRITAAPLLLAAALSPLAPQLLSNLRVYDRPSPLIVSSLYRAQTRWGMGNLKYGALLLPGEPPQLYYRNPFYRFEATPSDFLRVRPRAYLSTLGLHLFAMLDHDFVLTYPIEPHPWYRWPLSVINYVFLFLCMVGIIVFFREAARTDWRDHHRFSGLALLWAAACSLIFYLPTLVESRFSAPVELLLTPFLAQAIVKGRELQARHRWTSLAAGRSQACFSWERAQSFRPGSRHRLHASRATTGK